jgi:hypothetical protein
VPRKTPRKRQHFEHGCKLCGTWLEPEPEPDANTRAAPQPRDTERDKAMVDGVLRALARLDGQQGRAGMSRQG